MPAKFQFGVQLHVHEMKRPVDALMRLYIDQVKLADV